MTYASLILPYAAASSLVLSATLAAWYTGSQWLAHPRRLLPLGNYLFLLASGGVGYLATTRISHGWIIGLIGTLIFLGLIAPASKRIKLPRLNRQYLTLYAVLGLALLIAVPASGIAHALVQEHTATQHASSDLDHLQDYLAADQKKVVSAAGELASDPALIQGLLTPTPTLADTLQKQLVANKLDLLILTDAKGTVISRPHRPQANGDQLDQRLPWVIPLFSGKSLSGLATDEFGQSILVAGVPVLNDNKLIGTLLCGYVINAQYLSRALAGISGSWALYADSQVLATLSHSALDDQTLHSSPILDRISQLNSPHSFRVDAAGFPLLASYRSQPGLAGTITLVSLTHDQL